MTNPAEPGQDDLTADDHLVEQTDNSLRPDDPDDQPSQDPDELPAGTVVDGPDMTTPPATEVQEPTNEDPSVIER